MPKFTLFRLRVILASLKEYLTCTPTNSVKILRLKLLPVGINYKNLKGTLEKCPNLG
jgi:hypothetical protein